MRLEAVAEAELIYPSLTEGQELSLSPTFLVRTGVESSNPLLPPFIRLDRKSSNDGFTTLGSRKESSKLRRFQPTERPSTCYASAPGAEHIPDAYRDEEQVARAGSLLPFREEAFPRSFFVAGTTHETQGSSP
jgi:hypothetical protein